MKAACAFRLKLVGWVNRDRNRRFAPRWASSSWSFALSHLFGTRDSGGGVSLSSGHGLKQSDLSVPELQFSGGGSLGELQCPGLGKSLLLLSELPALSNTVEACDDEDWR